jgi:hypothetical protein
VLVLKERKSKFMKNIKLVALPVLLVTSSFTMAFASCSTSAYGTSCTNSDYNLTKTVIKAGSTDSKEKITGIKKGDTFTYKFKVENKTSDQVTLTLTDKLPSELEKVSGIDTTETIKVDANSSKNYELVAKVKDSEFANKTNFEKCIVNKAYINKGDSQKDSSTATVCYGEGVVSKLPQTGAEDLVLGAGVVSLALGLALKKFRK